MAEQYFQVYRDADGTLSVTGITTNNQLVPRTYATASEAFEEVSDEYPADAIWVGHLMSRTDTHTWTATS